MKFQLTMFTCKFCSAPLHSKGEGRKMRSDKEFCNNSCRAKYSAWKARVWVLASAVGRDLHEMGLYLDNPDTQEEAIKAFSVVLKDYRAETIQRGVEIKVIK